MQNMQNSILKPVAYPALDYLSVTNKVLNTDTNSPIVLDDKKDNNLLNNSKEVLNTSLEKKDDKNENKTMLDNVKLIAKYAFFLILFGLAVAFFIAGAITGLEFENRYIQTAVVAVASAIVGFGVTQVLEHVFSKKEETLVSKDELKKITEDMEKLKNQLEDKKLEDKSQPSSRRSSISTTGSFSDSNKKTELEVDNKEKLKKLTQSCITFSKQ